MYKVRVNNNIIKEAAEITTTISVVVTISVVAEAGDKNEAEISIPSPNDMRKIKLAMVMGMTELQNSSRGVKANVAEEKVAEEEEDEAVVETPIERIVKTLS